MSTGTRSFSPRQTGFVSVLVVLAIVMVAAVILKQSVQISATKSLTSLQQSDSVAALAQAQNGSEIAVQKLSAAFNTNPDLATACVAGNLGLTTENTALNGSGPASFSLVAAMASVNGYCKIRVKGSMRAASRTVETWVETKVTYGTVGFGTQPTLTLTNPFNDVKAIGLFNTGWGVKTSDGHSPLTGGNVDCTDCNSTRKLWYRQLTGSGRDIGGAGNYSTAINPLGSASYIHTLEAARNYAMVGHVLGGTSSQAPTTLGSLSSFNINNDSGTSTTAKVAADTNWCNTDNSANAIVIGVSAKGPGITDGQPDLSGKFTSAKFSFKDDNGPGIKVIAPAVQNKSYVHFPDTTVNNGLSPPIAWGDVFVELYYFYMDPVTIRVTSSSGKTLTLNQTYSNNSLVGRYLRPGGKIPDGTYITGNTGFTATLNNYPTSNFSSSTNICTGICGFFPSSNGTDMEFTFEKATGTVAKSWVGGIACLKGVNDNKVQVVTTPSGVTVLQWHEVLSNDSALF